MRDFVFADVVPAQPHLDALAAAASALDAPLPNLRNQYACWKRAYDIDALLARVARGRGAIELAIGERLEALGAGNGATDLGFASERDYAREVLGIAASTAQKMVHFTRELRIRPRLSEAVRYGDVTVRQAEAVLPVARGDVEEQWVARARKGTVRSLKAEVKDPGGAQPDDDEDWTMFRTQLPPEWRPFADEAMSFKDEPFSATMPAWERIEHACEEVLGTFDPPYDDGDVAQPSTTGSTEPIDPMEQWLEEQTNEWAFLDRVEPFVAPEARRGESMDSRVLENDPRLLDEELRRLSRLRDRWGEVFGRLARQFQQIDGARLLGFASFRHYCKERLGMSERAVKQRAAFEGTLDQLPALREAMRQRRISYEKARLIARYAADDSMEGWIDRAERITCIDLRRQLQGNEERKMCARNAFAAWLPRRVQGLLSLAFRAIRKAVGRSISPGECFGRVLKHFVDVWKPLLTGPNTVQRRVLLRDRGLCQVPGCSRAAAHAHHIIYRSAGGSDDMKNLVSLCAAHHLHGVHRGTVRVWGEAPDRLHWELGARPGLPPFREYVSTPGGPAVLVDRSETQGIAA